MTAPAARPQPHVRRRPARATRLEALGLRVQFGAGEELRTGISAKFTLARVRGDLEAAGLALEEIFTDADDLFAISLSEPGA